MMELATFLFIHLSLGTLFAAKNYQGTGRIYGKETSNQLKIQLGRENQSSGEDTLVWHWFHLMNSRPKKLGGNPCQGGAAGVSNNGCNQSASCSVTANKYLPYESCEFQIDAKGKISKPKEDPSSFKLIDKNHFITRGIENGDRFQIEILGKTAKSIYSHLDSSPWVRTPDLSSVKIGKHIVCYKKKESHLDKFYSCELRADQYGQLIPYF